MTYFHTITRYEAKEPGLIFKNLHTIASFNQSETIIQWLYVDQILECFFFLGNISAASALVVLHFLFELT